MKIRVVFIIISVFLLSGCPPKGAMLKQRSLQLIEVGLGVDGTYKILASNEEVDLLAGKVTSLMKEHGFELKYSSTSWGLQPLTGHTQNMSFGISGTDAIYCYVQISKKEFRAKFSELETKPKSGEFATTEQNLASIDEAVISLNELAKSTIYGRSTRVSKFDRAESPNKTSNPTP